MKHHRKQLQLACQTSGLVHGAMLCSFMFEGLNGFVTLLITQSITPHLDNAATSHFKLTPYRDNLNFSGVSGFTSFQKEPGSSELLKFTHFISVHLSLKN
jgi:hypothetical protein